MRSEDLKEGLTAFIEKRAAAVDGALTGARRLRPGDDPVLAAGTRAARAPGRPPPPWSATSCQRRSDASSPAWAARGLAPGASSAVKSWMTKWWSASMRSTQPTQRPHDHAQPGLLERPLGRRRRPASRRPPPGRPGTLHSPTPAPRPRRTSSSRPSWTTTAPTHTSGGCRTRHRPGPASRYTTMLARASARPLVEVLGRGGRRAGPAPSMPDAAPAASPAHGRVDRGPPPPRSGGPPGGRTRR